MKLAIHPLVDDYLRELEHAARVLPRPDRDELLAEIQSHLEEALPERPTEADIRNVLDQLGSPRDIVAAANPVPMPTVRRGAREVFALLLLVSGIPPVVGWLVGLGLLIWSPLWTMRQKLLGALVWPGGFFGAFVVFFAMPVGQSGVVGCSQSVHESGTFLVPGTAVCSSMTSGPPGWVAPLVAAILFAAPLLVAIYLWQAAGRRSAD